MATKTCEAGRRDTAKKAEKAWRKLHDAWVVPVDLPEWVKENEAEIRWVWLVALVVLFVHDASYNALGSTNGKFISLIDTINGVASYRAGLPKRYESKRSWGTFWYLLAMSFALKFVAQTFVSLCLGSTPVVFKGTRHITSFLLGYALVWFCPGDFIYRNLRKSPSIQLLFEMSCGLYKLRKSIYAVQASKNSGSLFFACFVMTVSLDGNTILRKLFLWMENTYDELLEDSDAVDWSDVIENAKDGVDSVLSRNLIPNFAVTLLLWSPALMQSLEVRIGLLVYFFSKQGTFDSLLKIHDLGAVAEREKEREANKPNKAKRS